ncbi:hypothetical protein ACLX1H_002602 [Fusarium chlamydosporum]
MCKHYIYDYEACRHSKLMGKELCWEAQVDSYCFCLSLSSWLFPGDSHHPFRIHTLMRGLCRDCDERQRNNVRRDYGDFTSQPAHGAESSQMQASDYSSGGLNEPPVRSPEQSYQPHGYQAQVQMNYSSPQPRAPGSSQIPSYGYARRLHHARFVGQPSRQPSNRQNTSESTISSSSDPSAYELQVSLGDRDSFRSENGRPRAAPRNVRPEPSPYELQTSLSNSDTVHPVGQRERVTQDNNNNNNNNTDIPRGRSRRRRPRRHNAVRDSRRGNLDVMDRLPRPAPEPRNYDRPVPRRVATLRGERPANLSLPSSPIDRADTVSPLTESDLRAPEVQIPEYDEYPEYPEFI